MDNEPDGLTLKEVRNLAMIWILSITGWIFCMIAKSICAFATPFEAVSSKLVDWGDVIISSDPLLRQTHKRVMLEMAKKGEINEDDASE